ncbi:hypothetical protein [Yinghuangia soli]|uniref:PknH-like extracellular domain-containing protein n=1 Tax=Yinghuangia soli TaxID=2908204 RepID=A0AA41Q7G5_9ACTN|nr:hypothetical protein [Yinghuangia soli]MCF2531582.1 hypothetical protein [Yinghuangia soli]
MMRVQGVRLGVAAVAAVLVLVSAGCTGSGGGGGGPTGAPTNDIARVLGGDTAKPDPGGGTPAEPPSSAPPAEDIPRGSEAIELAHGLPLAPADWGPKYQRQDGYEDASLTRRTLGADCKAFEDGDEPGAIAAMTRYTHVPDTAGGTQIYAVSGATAYDSVARAEAAMESTRADAERCPARTLGSGERLTSLSATDLEVPDADELIVVEATWVDARGDRSAPYVLVYARLGSVLVATLAVDLAAKSAETTQDLAFHGAATMLVNLKARL